MRGSSEDLISWMESAKGNNHDQQTLKKWFNQDLSNLSFPRSIHIAGTNGKGSVTVWLETLLKTKGLSAGSFTSPHLVHHTERYRMNQKPADRKQFLALLQKWQPVFSKRNMTMFEMDLWMACLLFSRSRPDWVLMETGMGGDRDATTILDYPYGIITPIGMDHMGFLGSSLGEIAQKKAGIIKPGMIIVTSEQSPEAMEVLKKRAQEQKAELIEIDPARAVPEFLQEHLPEYQKENFLCALTLLEQAGFRFSKQELEQAAEDFFWPARCQVLKENPLIILDGAHNAEGVKALTDSFHKKNQRFDRVFFSVLNDKPAREMIAMLRTVADQLILISFDNDRAADLSELQKKENLPLLSINEMFERLSENKSTLICGSLYFCGAVLERFSSKKEAELS